MNDQSITYSLQPFDPAGHRFRVVMTIPRPQAKGQVVSLPAWIPGSYLIRDFARHIESISASAGSRSLGVEKIDNHSWRVEPCAGPLQITIVVYAWDLSVRGAHLDETHGFFNGTSVFLQARGAEQFPCRVRLLPPPEPLRWLVYTSLPSAGRDNPGNNGFREYRADCYDALIDHPVEMGTPKVIRFTACGAPHELVFTGLAPNLDLKRIAADVRRICEAQIRFFEPVTQRAPFLDSADRYVFMTMLTGDGYGGLEHRASTALMAARNDLPVTGCEKAPEGYQTFLGLVSHEYFHTWNVKRIKPAAFAPYDLARESHTRLLWIFEGFTSYYDDLMLLRSGVIDRKDYLRILARQIGGVLTTPGRHRQSVADSSFDAWTRYYKQDESSHNTIVSYYTKGSLIALGLDLTIRARTQGRHSLDDVMRLLWNRFGRDFYTGDGKGLPERAFPALVREATGVDVAEELRRWAYGTHDVPLAELLAGAGIALRMKAGSSRPSLDVRVRTQGDHLTLASVTHDGAAHRGGLSAHDILVAVDGIRVGRTPATLDALLDRHRPGEIVQIHVFRRDELREFKVTLAAPSESDCVLEDMPTECAQ